MIKGHKFNFDFSKSYMTNNITQNANKICKCGKNIREFNNHLFENFITLDDFDYPMRKNTTICNLIKNIHPYCNHLCFNLKTVDILFTNEIPDEITLQELVEHVEVIGPLCYEELDMKCYKKILSLAKDVVLNYKDEILFESVKHLLNSKLSLYDISLMPDFFIGQFLDYKFKYMEIEEYEIPFDDRKNIYHYIPGHLWEKYAFTQSIESDIKYYMFEIFFYVGNMKLCAHIIHQNITRSNDCKNYINYKLYRNFDKFILGNDNRSDFIMALIIKLKYWDIIFDNLRLIRKHRKISKITSSQLKMLEKKPSLYGHSSYACGDTFEEFCESFKELLEMKKYFMFGSEYVIEPYNAHGLLEISILLNVSEEKIYSRKTKCDFKIYNYENKIFKKLFFYIISQKDKIIKSFGENVFFKIIKEKKNSGYKRYYILSGCKNKFLL